MLQNNKDNFLFITHKVPNGYLIDQFLYFNELANFSSFSTTIDYIELYLSKGPVKAEKNILEAIKQHQIRYVFVCITADFTFDISFYKKISDKAFLTFLFFDTPSHFDSSDKYYAQTANLVLLHDYYHTFKYKILEIPVLGNCISVPKEIIVYDENKNFDWDITFIGNIGAKNNRKNYIDALKAKQFNIDTFGIHSKHGFIDENEELNIFRKSKINLNFSGIQYSRNSVLGENISDRIREVKGRSFLVTSVGGFVLSEYFPGIETLFEIGKEIDIFYNTDDLIEKTRFYLNNDSLREQIAYNGFLRVKKDYSSDVAAKRIWDKICSLPRSINKTTYTDKIYRKAYTNYRFKYLVLYFIKFKPIFFFQEFAKIFRYGNYSFRFAWFYTISGFYESLSAYPQFRNKLKKILSYKIFAFLTHQKVSK